MPLTQTHCRAGQAKSTAYPARQRITRGEVARLV